VQLALTSALSRRAEELAAEQGSSPAVLMDRAGAAVAAHVSTLRPQGRVLVLAGPGNNGGDGWAAASVLHAQGRDVLVLTVAPPDSLPEPGLSAARSADGRGVPWRRLEALFELERELAKAGVVVDALLGVGVRGPLRDPLPAVAGAVADAGVPVVAADVPTGVDADTGAIASVAVAAAITVTFGALKTGLLQYPGAGSAGVVVTADIGLPFVEGPGAVEVWEGDDYADEVPRIAPDANKGSRGRVLVVAGSAGMSGAAVLAASAAQRAGAGYVTLAVPASLLDLADAAVVSAVTRALPETGTRALREDAGAAVLALASSADAVVIGPGLGLDPGTIAAVRDIVAGCSRPMVVDADALNILAMSPEVLAARTAPTVVSPHPGEAARLLGLDVAGVQEDRWSAARALSGPGRVALLKGARSVIASMDRVAVNMTGNPGMATTGTGDVLSGVVGALMAQGCGAFEAAVLGAYLHGRAGDRASERVGPSGMVAEDLLPELPGAVAELTRRPDHGVR
jgi:hydroxyethylthiazole kinase-like uncharacterized protein yjeF